MKAVRGSGVESPLSKAFEISAAASSIADSASGKKTQAATISLRVSTEERQALERASMGMSLSAYVRERLFGDGVPKRRTRGKAPVKDHAALARVLSALGRSNLASDLDALRWAEEDGVLVLDFDTSQAIRRACTDIVTMRGDLVRALGLRSS